MCDTGSTVRVSMAGVAELHHFAFGWFNPVVAFVMAFLGSLLGLVCTARARLSTTRRRRIRWLVFAAIAIGGAGIWLMHFMAMLGFDVPRSQVRYDPVITIGSLAIAVVTVGIGLFIAGLGRPRAYKILLGGLATGAGVSAMHYTGVFALQVGGSMSFDPGLTGASVLIAVVASTVALWFTVQVKGWKPIIAAAVVMAVAVVGMHYTAMAALQIRLSEVPVPIGGVNPVMLIVPITVLTAAALMGTAISALQVMTEEEFGDASTVVVLPASLRLGGVHAETPWQLRERAPASLS
jgi:NO-binding membrane sensor protein with MHYT domain